MKRRNFIAVTLAAPLVFTGQPKPLARPVKTNPFSVKKGEGRYHGHISQREPNANILDVKVSGTDTGGNLAVPRYAYRRPLRYR